MIVQCELPGWAGLQEEMSLPLFSHSPLLFWPAGLNHDTPLPEPELRERPDPDRPPQYEPTGEKKIE